jgi:hypothetical protein
MSRSEPNQIEQNSEKGKREKGKKDRYDELPKKYRGNVICQLH